MSGLSSALSFVIYEEKSTKRKMLVYPGHLYRRDFHVEVQFTKYLHKAQEEPVSTRCDGDCDSTNNSVRDEHTTGSRYTLLS